MPKTSANKARLAWLLTGLLALPGLARADVNFTGYLKSFAIAQDSFSNPVLEAPVIYQSQNSGRFMWEGFGSHTVWQIHYELSPLAVSRHLETSLPTFNVGGGNYRLSDPDATLSNDEEDKNLIYQNLDRFNVQFQFDIGDLTLGRQAISFGSARVINPTDIFLPFDVRTFNTEYRTGVDAIRFQRPIGQLGEIDAGLVLGDNADADNSAAFLQLRGNYKGKDLHLAMMQFANQHLVGVGLQGALGSAGFWFEVADVSGDVSYSRFSMGLDYAFTGNTFAQVEYHHNGAGSNNPADYPSLADDLPYQRGGVFLLGQDYLMPMFSVQVSPLWTLATQGIYNLSDDSAFISLTAEYNVAEDAYMDFGYYHFFGNDITLDLQDKSVLESEYGSSPDTLYLSLRYYF